MTSCGRPRLRPGYAGLFPEYGFVVPFCPIREKYGAYPKMTQTYLNPELHIRAVCRVTTQPTFAPNYSKDSKKDTKIDSFVLTKVHFPIQ